MRKDPLPPSPAQDHGLVQELFMGFCLGAANIIPGVSGGTFLLVFNIYERVFAVLNQINRALVLKFATLVFCVAKNMGRKGSLRDLVLFLEETDALFLLKLMVGALAAILALSSLMKYLLVHQFAYTYSLFFGLILVSIIIPIKLLNSLKGPVVLMALLGMSLTVFVSWSVNPYDKVKIKSDHLERQYLQLSSRKDRGADAGHGSLSGKLVENEMKKSGGSGLLASFGKYTLEEYLYAGICGAVSISAMVLPGISGSLVLILMGAYFDVIAAISALKSGNLDTLAFLFCFGAGILAGGLLFARLINFVLNRYYNPTMAFLAGLMAGSLYALWPFKKVMIMARQYVRQEGGISVVENFQVYTNVNILPSSSHQLLISLVFFAAGCAVMAAFIRTESS
jgi:putative membrane protein